MFQEFLDGERATTCLTNEIRNELLQAAALEITGCYNELATDIVNMVSEPGDTDLCSCLFPGFPFFQIIFIKIYFPLVFTE